MTWSYLAQHSTYWGLENFSYWPKFRKVFVLFWWTKDELYILKLEYYLDYPKYSGKKFIPESWAKYIKERIYKLSALVFSICDLDSI